MPLPPIVEAGPSVKAQRLSDLLKKDLGDFPEWIGPRVLPKRGTLLFGGYAKIGKSWTMLEFARCLALGVNPFSHDTFNVQSPCTVLMIEQELGEYGLQERGRMVFNPYSAEQLNNLYYVSKEPGLVLDTPAGVNKINSLVAETGANVLIMDPISWMHGWDENSNTEVAKLFAALERIKKKFESQDLSIVISHHFGKPPGAEDAKMKDPLDSYNFRGASKWKDAPDSLVTMIRRGTKHAPHEHWNLETRWVTRHGPSPPDMILEVNHNNDGRVYAKNKTPKIKPVPKASDMPPAEQLSLQRSFTPAPSPDYSGRRKANKTFI